MSEKIKQEGWVVMTPTLCQGETIGWKTENDAEETIPIVYESVENAWKEIAEDMIIMLQQFIDGEREFDCTDFATEDYPALYQEFENGSFVVSDEEGNPILESTLEDWRANL